MMIPLRRALIVKEHGRLTYPEGTACAQVLIVGEQGGTNAKTVFQGFGWRSSYVPDGGPSRLWKDEPGWIRVLQGATISAEVSPVCSASATSSARDAAI